MTGTAVPHTPLSCCWLAGWTRNNSPTFFPYSLPQQHNLVLCRGHSEADLDTGQLHIHFLCACWCFNGGENNGKNRQCFIIYHGNDFIRRV